MLFAPLLAEEAPGLVVQPYWVLVSIVQFGLLFFLLQKFLWGPVMKTLQARAAKIREGLDAAAAAKAEREQMTKEVERLLADARREAAALADRSTQAAEAAANLIKTEARTEAERIRQRAASDATQLHDQALAQLRGEVANMVVAATSRILGVEVDPAKHRALIERSLDETGRELGKAN